MPWRRKKRVRHRRPRRRRNPEYRREGSGNYKTRHGVHIAFGRKAIVKVTFHKASRQAKRYYVVVSRNHVHITRLARHTRRRHKKRRRRQRRRFRRNRRQRNY